MARKPIAKSTETAVLVQSRRRCAICFGLDRDVRLKSGQLAHLDRDNANNAEDNIAFLCLNHHDEYDSPSSQRKNFSVAEVKRFRSELYANVNKAFSQPVHFGEMKLPPADPFAGDYTRLDSVENGAELKLTPLPDSYEGDARYFVTGLAIWGAWRPGGPNLGTIEFVGQMSAERQLVHRRARARGQEVVTELSFNGDGVLEVRETNWIGEYGMNVTFGGNYRRGLPA